MRYFLEHVADGVQRLPDEDGSLQLPNSDRRALLVYAQGTPVAPGQAGKLDATKRFAFFPLRFATIVRIQKQGTVFYADLQLGSFPDLRDHNRNTTASLSKFRAFCEHQGQCYPLPAPPFDGGNALVWDSGGSGTPTLRAVAKGEKAA